MFPSSLRHGLPFLEGPAVFETIDRLRRSRGRWMDRLGFGPVRSRSRLIAERPGYSVRVFEPPPGRSDPAPHEHRPAVVIVPAPIKQAYIWDLQPDASVVRRLRRLGVPVAMIEWRPADQGAPAVGLAGYAGRYLAEALAVLGEQPDWAERPVVLAGHSLGGTLAAIYAASRPRRVVGLILIEAPLRFGTHAGALAPVIAAGPPAGAMVAGWRYVPGSLLSLTSLAAAPGTFLWSVLADRAAVSAGMALDPAALRLHQRVRRWADDEFAMPTPLFADIVEHLYRDDRFCRGTLFVEGRPAAADRIAVPVAAVVDPLSAITPVEACLPPVPAFDRRNCQVLAAGGEFGVGLRHVGALVGRGAHRVLWPKLAAWCLARASDTAADSGPGPGSTDRL